MLESCMKIFPDLFNQNIRDEFQVCNFKNFTKIHILCTTFLFIFR